MLMVVDVRAASSGLVMLDRLNLDLLAFGVQFHDWRRKIRRLSSFSLKPETLRSVLPQSI